MNRRIYGLETEYGITCVLKGQRRLSPDEAARYLFRSVVQWGRSSNVFMENGGRLYLDVGSHPEFATPECDSPLEVVLYDKAGETILQRLVEVAEGRLREEGIRGSLHLFKNNTDSAGNSYGCHENFLLRRQESVDQHESVFIPFLVSRQIFTGAGKILSTSKGPVYCVSQRAEHIWEGVSSATTRSRPIINTRDEPHADAEEFRRLHVIVGDSNMSEFTSFVKVGSAACVLRMMEHDGFALRDFTLENPIRAIREISSDMSCRRTVRLASGAEVTALDVQRHLVDRAREFEQRHGFPEVEVAGLRAWEMVVDGLSADPLRLDRHIDWVIKYRLLDAYCARHGLDLSSPEAAMIDLQYHDIDPDRGLFNRLVGSDRAVRLFTDEQVSDAADVPPQSTRARLRGEFIRRAKARNRDVTVDWVHLKVNDQAQRTVVCKDPFKSRDERVERLLDSL